MNFTPPTAAPYTLGICFASLSFFYLVGGTDTCTLICNMFTTHTLVDVQFSQEAVVEVRGEEERREVEEEKEDDLLVQVFVK